MTLEIRVIVEERTSIRDGLLVRLKFMECLRSLFLGFIYKTHSNVIFEERLREGYIVPFRDYPPMGSHAQHKNSSFPNGKTF